ncbi:hypothetical protein [Acidithiobacillus ferridurans]|uniref:hypothetical protein n=1 Tax=Acidithiobacillus ferridurans TaxID=1232575 RepID=UPI001D031799|nr:hypothetical protein [Acidithiobacillus ferridurans]
MSGCYVFRYLSKRETFCQHTLFVRLVTGTPPAGVQGAPRQAGNILHTVLRLAVATGLNHLPDDLLQAAIKAL